MLEVSEDVEETDETDDKSINNNKKKKSSIHGDLYDTLFTLQTLNNKSGLEEFMSRVRSVYETKHSMGKSTTTKAANPSEVQLKPVQTQRHNNGKTVVAWPHGSNQSLQVKLGDSPYFSISYF